MYEYDEVLYFLWQIPSAFVHEFYPFTLSVPGTSYIPSFVPGVRNISTITFFPPPKKDEISRK